MKMVLADYYNQYHVNGKFVEDIVLYDDSGELVRLESSYLSDIHGSAVKDIPEIVEVANRRTLRLDRKEHFTVTQGGERILYIYLGAFKDVTINPKQLAYTYPEEWVYKYTVMFTAGDSTVVAASRLEEYTTRVPTPEAPLIERIREIYDASVTDHPRRSLTTSAAARLIEALPRMVEALEQHKAGNL